MWQRNLLSLLFLLLFFSNALAQPVAYPGLARKVRNGTTLPSTCTVGDAFMDTDATSGQRFYLCESANTWTLQGDGGGGGGSGDVTDVGDCDGPACFTGTEGNTLTFKGATSGTTALKPTAIAGTTTITMPAETGTMCTTGSVCSGYQASLGYTPVNAADWTTINSYPAGCAANSFVNTIGDTLTCGTSISGNAATATALAANGANCSSGAYPLGVDASGASETCTTAASTAADYITGSAQATLSAEQSLGALTTGLLLNTVAASTGTVSAYGGTSCTNQFPRSLNASGAATCADVALTTDTSGNYAAGDAEAGAALTGDTATAFFAAGQIEAARGGTGIDSSGSTGVARISAGTWSANAGISHLASSTSADLSGVLSNETGTGVAVFGTSPNITTSINDSGGNELFKLTATGSAVNEFTVANAATGGDPTLSVTGDSDANIDIALTAKGTGGVIITSTNAGPDLITHGLTVNNDGLSAATSNYFTVKGENSDTLFVVDTTNETITSGTTGSVGWSIVDQTDNQACTTGCTSGCMFGIENATGTAVTNLVDCSATTADLCACMGPS